MKCTLTALLLSVYATSFSQALQSLDDKWCFTGLRTTLFNVENGHLYVGLLNYNDTLNFKKFINDGFVDDTLIFSRADIIGSGDTIIIKANFPKVDHELILEYSPLNPSAINYTGDVYFDSTHVINTNRNCRLSKPSCINTLYSKEDLLSMIKKNSPEKFTRDNAYEFLVRLSVKLKDKCNRCYPGFTDAYMNEVLIEMGFNPITRQPVANSLLYNTSGFTFFLKTRFEQDKAIRDLSQYVLDQYIRQP
jgi:hypothetical protein